MTSVADLDWAVISLARTPDRLAQFSAINGHLGLPFRTLEAVDGFGIDREELVRSGLMVPDLQWRPGALGAAMSHRQCWLNAVESGRALCILEDDVYLRHDFVQQANSLFAALPDSWDLMQFGFNVDAVLDVELAPGLDALGHFSPQFLSVEECELFVRNSGDVIPLRLHSAFGNCCYAVSPAGAQKLLDGVFPLSAREILVQAYPAVLVPQSKDVLMNSLYRDMSAFISVPPLAVLTNDKQISTVWAE